MADIVVVKCKTCGEEPSAGIEVDPSTLESLDLADHRVECLECGRSHLYDKDDMYFAT